MKSYKNYLNPYENHINSYEIDIKAYENHVKSYENHIRLKRGMKGALEGIGVKPGHFQTDLHKSGKPQN